MLQQTQADRVAGRFERFIERFPDESALAASQLVDVLDEWQGLGYNSRARRLREAARFVTAHGWPTTVSGLEALPGVGAYTAAAIAALAFGEDCVAVDTNVRRVVSRWSGTALSDAEIRAVAQPPVGSAGRWLEAVMDLGATVCRPRPDCSRCPVARWCADPDVYVPPRKQSPLEGSVRQTRAAIVSTLTNAPHDIDRLRAALGDDHADRFDRALTALVAEGMVERDRRRLAIAR